MFVTKDDIVSGLRELGIKTGDELMVHSSLKSFGRVEGGADAVIDALLEVVTENGIVSMPAFSDCTDGGSARAYDRVNTPPESWIGIIPETFRKRKGVLRSDHPTHSITASGLDAKAFLSQTDIYDCFAEDGPWNRLREGGGKLLFIGKTMGSNTFLHACEAWYNNYLEETIGIVATPEGEKFVRVTNYPSGCRGGWYKLYEDAEYFKILRSRGIFSKVEVGASTLMVCNAHDVAATMKEIFKSDPHILLHKSGCRDCARMRGKNKPKHYSPLPLPHSEIL